MHEEYVAILAEVDGGLEPHFASPSYGERVLTVERKADFIASVDKASRTCLNAIIEDEVFLKRSGAVLFDCPAARAQRTRCLSVGGVYRRVATPKEVFDFKLPPLGLCLPVSCLDPEHAAQGLVEQVVGRIEGDPKPECQPRKQTCVRVCLMSADDCQCDPSASST